MARIKSYAQDTNVTDQDRILGTSFEGILNNKPIYKTRNYKITDLAAYFSQNFDFEGLNFNVALLSETITANTQAIASANLSLSVLTTDVLAQATFQVNLAASFGTYDDQGNLLTLAESFANQVLQTTSSTRFAEATALTELETTFTSDIADVNASISAEQLARSTADTALASDITTLEASVADDVSELQASITSEQTARVTQDEALAQDITTLETTVGNIPLIFRQDDPPSTANPVGSLWFDTNDGNKRYILVAGTPNTWEQLADGEFTQFKATAESQLSTLTTDISSEAQKITNLNAVLEILDENGDLIPLNQADYFDTITTYVDTNSATASAVTTLEAEVDGNLASITQNQTAIATVDGKLTASYALQVDAGGRVAGLKLLADGTTGSEFIARANTFAVDMPNGTRVMTVNSGGMTINGNGTFSGNISAASGTFNGVTINSSGITGSGFSLTSSGLNLSNSSSSISIGSGVTINQFGISGVNFSLTNGGLSASNATISGNITITSGTTLNAITDAQSTANTAIDDASDAQSTANAANTTANTANTTANTALGRTVDAAGKIVFNPAPSGSGLFMNATNLGYYDGGSWKTYMQNNGNFFLSGSGGNGLSWDGSTLTVNGSGVFSGELQAGLVNINGNVIRVGVNSTYNTFGELNFVHPNNTTSVGKVKGYYYTSGGSPAGGGIALEAASGASVRLGSNFSGAQYWQIESSFSSIQGTSSSMIFYNSSNNYRFLNPASGSGTTAVFDASGNLKKLSSSLRYKENVINYDKGVEDIKRLRPVYYKNKNEYNIHNAGFIAEEMHDLGFEEYVRYDLQGRPDAISYQNMVALLTKGMQEQQKQIDALKAEIELLKAQ